MTFCLGLFILTSLVPQVLAALVLCPYFLEQFQSKYTQNNF
jgi:hypothetical protein